MRASISNSRIADPKPSSESAKKHEPAAPKSQEKTSLADTLKEKFVEITKNKPLIKRSNFTDRELLLKGRAKRLTPIKLQWLNAIKTQRTPNAKAPPSKMSPTEATRKPQTLLTTSDIAKLSLIHISEPTRPY